MNNGKMLRIEIVSQNSARGNHSAVLELPASPQEIADAKQKARISPTAKGGYDVGILDSECPYFIEMKRLDATSVEELNYYAQRISQLDEKQRDVHQALFNAYCDDADAKKVDLISIKDLINMTFNLDSVPYIENVGDKEALGEYVIANELNPLLDSIPDELLPVIDREKLGAMQIENDNGGFIHGNYIPTALYDRIEMYDGEHIPGAEENADSVIFTAIKGSNGKIKVFAFPSHYDVIAKTLQELEIKCFEDCQVLAVESSIPHISGCKVGSMDEMTILSRIANRYAEMSEADRVKYKAVIEAENLTETSAILDAAYRLCEYELDVRSDSPDSFFVNYLSGFTDNRLDSKWLEGISCYAVGSHLINRIDAHLTSYGVLSARCGNLFEPVPYDEQSIAETEEPVNTEKLEVIEILGRSALFSNNRISKTDLPDGLYVYDLRGDDDGGGRFVSVEPRVLVNHSGSIITKEPFDFGENGYISLDDDTSPNFTGEEMTVGEFAAAEFEQTEEPDVDQTDGEDTGMGGMDF